MHPDPEVLVVAVKRHLEEGRLPFGRVRERRGQRSGHGTAGAAADGARVLETHLREHAHSLTVTPVSRYEAAGAAEPLGPDAKGLGEDILGPRHLLPYLRKRRRLDVAGGV